MPCLSKLFIALSFPLWGLLMACGQVASQGEHPYPEAMLKTEQHQYKATFVELGSVRCISCRKMQIVMDAIREKYGDEVAVVFHDVLTPEGKPFAKYYGINLIPTQVFLDADGKEYHRHEGYLPEAEVVKIMEQQTVTSPVSAARPSGFRHRQKQRQRAW